MIPTVRETLQALAGLWHFAREGAPALRYFDRSMAGFWRAFGGALLLAPLQILMIATDIAMPADGAGWFRLITGEASAYVIQWVAFPLALYYIASGLGRVAEYVDFVIVNNWTNVPWMPINLVLLRIAVGGQLSGGLIEFLAIAFYAVTLSFEWFIARQTLRIGGAAAAGLVALDFSIAIVVQSAVRVMVGA